ncbi:Nramp family divalent metal transporter [Schlesneria paludicola]|uniref:Nramp family divalent metal transporter n=1 Tax=Schlesneria paludicola TaxID=360056 RepID=UPI00030E7FFF|nr:Nramp family divalent metal transporter [Schlesneria paludicola]
MSEATEYDPYALPPDVIQDPPTSLWQALRKIGPGIILAGTIVGSGELLLTTSLGANYGFVFLWLILYSCVVKVFVQTELGRYAISSGKPTLGAVNELSGPRLGANWIVWWWFVMMLTTIFQLGAMTGTVGQSLNLAFPGVTPALTGFLESSAPQLADVIRDRPEYPWAVLTCLMAMLLLWSGSYRRIESITTFLVVTLTIVTVVATASLPATKFPIPWNEVVSGLTFGLPPEGIAAAFGVFGITGVGAAELFYYPYWCLEKGYARYVGQCDGSPEWERRARGWIRVMYLDAWVSMVVFTISTVAFYCMGATVLHPQGLHPQGRDMILHLSRMFVDTFGTWTQIAFLIGAGAVLFKTLYLSSAGNARLVADAVSLASFVRYRSPHDRARVVHWVSLLIPVIALLLFLTFKEPRWMVVVGGFGQALTLPIITAATIYFRYRKLDRRLTPSLIIDLMLWLAFISITCVAIYALRDQVMKFLTPAAAA